MEWIRVGGESVTKPCNLDSVLRSLMVGEGSWVPQVPLASAHILWCAHTGKYTLTAFCKETRHHIVEQQESAADGAFLYIIP